MEVRLQNAPKRRYRAKGLMSSGPKELKFFNDQEQREMTVTEYYERQYHHQ